MLYVLTGKGDMPPKEATTTLAQLLERVEQDAERSGLEEVDFWLAVDSDNVDPEHRFWNQVAQWASDNEVYVADTGDAAETLASAGESALLVLPVDPEFGDPADDDLVAKIEAAAVLGRTVYCLNGQMYEVEVEETPDVDEAPEVPDLGAMSLADLKSYAREIGAEPTDWRSRATVLAAVHEHLNGDTPVHTPMNTIEVSNSVDENRKTPVDTQDAPVDEPTAEVVPEAVPSQHGADGLPVEFAALYEDVEALVERVVKEQFTSLLLDCLSRLGLGD